MHETYPSMANIRGTSGIIYVKNRWMGEFLNHIKVVRNGDKTIKVVLRKEVKVRFVISKILGEIS